MNFPADMLPMYTASMSSERSLASWIAFSPASIPRSRKERSHNSPNSVSPTPMTATSRAEADQDDAAARVPDPLHLQPYIPLRFLVAELLDHPACALSVRLVEDRVVVVPRGRAGRLGEELRAVAAVLQVSGLAPAPT